MTTMTGHEPHVDAETRGRGDGEVRGRGDAEKLEGNSLPRTQKRSHRPHPRVLVLLLIVVAAAFWWYYQGLSTPAINGIVASGTIEAEETSISPEVPGRIVQILAEEGDRVRAGDVLVRLDDSVPRLQLRMASLAERQLLELQLDKMSIRSPMDGIVARRSLRTGEVASPGSTIMVVSNLDQVELTLYVPEREIGRVKPGQRAEVKVDSFPKESFPGLVTFIATRAEFTPRNVQTQQDRLSLVFAVKVRIPNPDLRLKPGMPADAVIRTED